MTHPASVGPYEILAELGSGTTGIVNKACHVAMPDRIVALKVPRLGPGSEARWRANCYQMEWQLLACLTHKHDPRFATLYDVGIGKQEHPVHHYTREYIDGVTLEQLATTKTMTLRSGISILATVAKAVTVVHARDYAHRNLHPSNVLVPVSGEPKLIGFGLVWILAGSNLLPPGVPGVSAEVDVRALQHMLDWLCATLGQPIPAPLEALRRSCAIPCVARLADALDNYLQAQ